MSNLNTNNIYGSLSEKCTNSYTHKILYEISRSLGTPKPIHIIPMPHSHVVQVLGSCVEEEISKRAKKTLRKSNQEEFNGVLLRYIRLSQEQCMVLEEQTYKPIPRFWHAYKVMSFTEAAGSRQEQWGGLGKSKICILDMLTLR